MTEAIINALCTALPGVRIIPPYQRKREKCVVYRFCPGNGRGELSRLRVELRFVAPSLDEARRMYRTAREAIVSDGDRARIGEGKDAVLVEEIAEGGGSGYIIKTGLYFIKAGFLAVGYGGNGGNDDRT